MNKVDEYSTIETKRKIAGARATDSSLDETNYTVNNHKHSSKNSTISHEDDVLMGTNFTIQQMLNNDDHSSGDSERLKIDMKAKKVPPNTQHHSQINESFQTFPSQDENRMLHDISISEISYPKDDPSFYSDKISIPRVTEETTRLGRLTARTEAQYELKASEFYKTKLYYKSLLLLKSHAQNMKRARRKFLFYLKKSRRRYLFDAFAIWQKLLLLKDVSLTHRSTGYISTRRARNVKQQPSYNIDIQKSIVDMDPIHIHTYLCLKKAWKGMIIILNKKRANERAYQFQYYNIMFKHWFKWREYIKNKPYFPESNIPTKRSENDLRSIPSAYPSARYSQFTTPNEKDPLRVSYITDADLSYNLSKSYIDNYEDGAVKYRNLIVKKKAFLILQSYLLLQGKKKHLNMLFIQFFKKKYMQEPFTHWYVQFNLTQDFKKKKCAASILSKILRRVVLNVTFAKIQEARRVLTTKRRLSQPGTIVRQTPLINKTNMSVSNITRDNSILEDKENISINLSQNIVNTNPEAGYKKLKSQLAQIFPSKNPIELPKPKQTDHSVSSIQMNSSIMHNKTNFVTSFIQQNDNFKEILTGLNDQNISIISNIPEKDTSNISIPPLPLDNKENVKRNLLKKFEEKQIYTKSIKEETISTEQSLASTKVIQPPISINFENSPESYKDRYLRKKTLQNQMTKSMKVNPTKKKSINAVNQTTIEPQRDNSFFSSRDPSPALNLSEITKVAPRRSVQNSRSSSVRPASKGRQKTAGTQTNIQVPIKHENEEPEKDIEPKKMTEAQRERYKAMIADLEEHLKFLNRKLLDQKLVNKMLTSIREQIIQEGQHSS